MSEKKYKSIPSKRSDRSSRFHKQLVVEIVREIEEGLPRKEACEKYSMAYSTLGEWMIRYGSEIYHATKRISFSAQQRRSITRTIQEGRMTKDEALLIHKVVKKTL